MNHSHIFSPNPICRTRHSSYLPIYTDLTCPPSHTHRSPPSINHMFERISPFLTVDLNSYCPFYNGTHKGRPFSYIAPFPPPRFHPTPPHPKSPSANLRRSSPRLSLRPDRLLHRPHSGARLVLQRGHSDPMELYSPLLAIHGWTDALAQRAGRLAVSTKLPTLQCDVLTARQGH